MTRWLPTPKDQRTGERTEPTSWAVFVAVERHPERAARLRELEHIVDAGAHLSAAGTSSGLNL